MTHHTKSTLVATPATGRFHLRNFNMAALIAVLGWSLSAAVQAQSLPELVEMAKNYDATVLAARAQAQASAFKIEQSKALYLPFVGMNITARQSNTEAPALAVPQVGSNLNRNEKQIGFKASQPLLNKSNWVTRQQALASHAVAESDLQSAEQDLIIRVAQAYFDVLTAQETLQTAQANQKAIGEQLAFAKRNFEVGNATITDSREAQARSDLARAQAIAAANDLQVKTLALEILVGKTSLQPTPYGPAMQMPALQPNDAQSWIELAQQNSPLLKKARTAYEISQLELEKRKAGHWPTLDLIGTLGRASSSGEQIFNSQGNTSQNNGSARASTVGLEFNLPLYTGGATHNQVKEAAQLQNKSQYELEAAQRAVEQGTRTAFLGVQSGLAQIEALEASAATSKLALEATQLGYRVGVRVNIDVLNAQTQLYNTQKDLAKARYDTMLGLLKLRQATGTLRTETLMGSASGSATSVPMQPRSEVSPTPSSTLSSTLSPSPSSPALPPSSTLPAQTKIDNDKGFLKASSTPSDQATTAATSLEPTPTTTSTKPALWQRVKDKLSHWGQAASTAVGLKK